MKARRVLSMLVCLAMVFACCSISVMAEDAVKVYSSGKNELVLKSAFAANGCYGAIRVENDATLSIWGYKNEGKVHGVLCQGTNCNDATCGYAMAVFARNDATVIINGGSYTNDKDTVSNDQDHTDLIYARDNANIIINGGTFKCDTPQWTLNCRDKSSAKITVKGGTFFEFDPSKANVGANEIVVADGYEVVSETKADGTWYTVKEILTGGNKVYDQPGEYTLELTEDIVANGCDGAIYVSNGAHLTIVGDANVHGVVCKGTKCGGADCGYGMAVFAEDEGTKVIIKGGTYTNGADDVSDLQDHTDLIYAKNGAEIEIQGGTFECNTPKWTLNCRDNSNAKITVKGGSFVGFDPANANVGAGEIIVADGLLSGEIDGSTNIFTREEAEAAYEITTKDTEKVINGEVGGIRWTFNANVENAPAGTTAFGAYIVPANIFEASSVSKARQVEYEAGLVSGNTFAADLVNIPEEQFTRSIVAIPYIVVGGSVITYASSAASVQ